MSNIDHLKQAFEEIYHQSAERTFFSPGRINLIGEHTDYNGGHVFPCAITIGTYGLVSMREDKWVHCYSTNFSESGIIQINLENLAYAKQDGWANYVKGMLKYMQAASQPFSHGFNLLIEGNIPNGAGLSSSASLEMLVGVIADAIYDLKMDRIKMVKIGQQVENKFIGVNSGIMDQFAIGMGQVDQAIFLDVNTLDYQFIPADFKDYRILIMNTNKRRELADSKYNERRSQCEAALEQLKTELKINTLGDLDNESFEANRYLIQDPILAQRAKHAVYENTRTIAAKALLQAGDLEKFGQLLNESHISLRDDYDVTGIELDTLVESAWKHEAVLGARMTGAGMGGCAIALVQKDAIDEVSESIKQDYEAKIGYPPSFYIAQVGDGSKELTN
ncbi:galactokinase [Fundicoccus culcitae]|uniref:Galactokinase n=1 Tax=Fundicoccus culcitae TaxID=2969821 RepID=A0ABY5P7S5_9LACT|nr:galactokinase [Fundicoccus culcitae]UUX34453.1 galactokinase [Fundicoccus culcitae]